MVKILYTFHFGGVAVQAIEVKVDGSRNASCRTYLLKIQPWKLSRECILGI